MFWLVDVFVTVDHSPLLYLRYLSDLYVQECLLQCWEHLFWWIFATIISVQLFHLPICSDLHLFDQISLEVHFAWKTVWLFLFLFSLNMFLVFNIGKVSEASNLPVSWTTRDNSWWINTEWYKLTPFLGFFLLLLLLPVSFSPLCLTVTLPGIHCIRPAGLVNSESLRHTWRISGLLSGCFIS